MKKTNDNKEANDVIGENKKDNIETITHEIDEALDTTFSDRIDRTDRNWLNPYRIEEGSWIHKNPRY